MRRKASFFETNIRVLLSRIYLVELISLLLVHTLQIRLFVDPPCDRTWLKRNNQVNSDEDDSLELTTTAFTNKTGFTARTVSFEVPKESGRIEKALMERGISSERFRSWKEANGIEFNVILKIHSTTAHRVRGIRKVLKNWTGTAVADGPSKNT